MIRRSIVQYAAAVGAGGRYFQAAKKAKTGILNGFVTTMGMHRKTVIRLLNRGAGG